MQLLNIYVKVNQNINILRWDISESIYQESDNFLRSQIQRSVNEIHSAMKWAENSTLYKLSINVNSCSGRFFINNQFSDWRNVYI